MGIPPLARGTAMPLEDEEYQKTVGIKEEVIKLGTTILPLFLQHRTILPDEGR